MFKTFLKALLEKALYNLGTRMGSEVAWQNLVVRRVADQIMYNWRCGVAVHGFTSHFGSVQHFIRDCYRVELPYPANQMDPNYLMDSDQVDRLFKGAARLLMARGDV